MSSPLPPGAWESYLSERFPGFLLPDAQRRALDVPTARQFLAHLTGRQDQLELLCAASLVSACLDPIREFATRWLPDLVRQLPSRTTRVRREWQGGFQGRLDVPATLAARSVGRATTFVTREQRRSFALPESELVKVVAHRLKALLEGLREEGVTADYGWGEELVEVEGGLRECLLRSRLADVELVHLEDRHRRAALAARHRAYHVAARLDKRLHEVIDAPDPAKLAHVVAEGALVAVEESRRFELAVLARLIQRLSERATAGLGRTWFWERSLVVSGRREVAVFRDGQGVELSVHFDQAVLPAGTRDRGVERYLGHKGRLRPDITLVRRSNGQLERACCIEVKCSSDPGYLAEGFGEAVLYAREYEPLTLGGWPASVLVTPGESRSMPRYEDRCIAVGWAAWPPDELVDGLLA